MQKNARLLSIPLIPLALLLMPQGGGAQPPIPVCSDIDILASIALPPEFTETEARPHGIAFDNHSLWVACYGCGFVYKLGFDTLGGLTIEDSIETPTSNPTGTTFIGKTLLVGDDITLKITRFKTKGAQKGQVTDWFYAPGAPDEDCVGLTHGRGRLYNSDWVWSTQGGMIHEMNMNGNLIESYFFPAWDCPEGLTFDGKSLWLAEACENRIYRLSADDLSPVCYFDGPGNFPIGLTFDGHHLWLSDFNTEKLYKIDIGAGP